MRKPERGRRPRPWMDARRPESLRYGFVLLRDARGRALGMFFTVADARAWVARRVDSAEYLAQCYGLGSRVAFRWRLRAIGGGMVEGELLEGDERGEVR